MAGMERDPMRISIIVAMAQNGVIGRGLALPWRLSADLRRFRTLTTGHHVIMGRRTWESINRQLPGRSMIVVTRQQDFDPCCPDATDLHVAHSLPQALDMARRAGESEAFVIGGRSLYAEALPLADRFYLTRVLADVTGDVYFPDVDWSRWRCVASENHPADDKNDHAMRFETHEVYPSRKA